MSSPVAVKTSNGPSMTQRGNYRSGGLGRSLGENLNSPNFKKSPCPEHRIDSFGLVGAGAHHALPWLTARVWLGLVCGSACFGLAWLGLSRPVLCRAGLCSQAWGNVVLYSDVLACAVLGRVWLGLVGLVCGLGLGL